MLASVVTLLYTHGKIMVVLMYCLLFSQLLKTLQKLQGLDVSLDILSETGIGKTVNSLRNHKEVGDVAKSVVRYWKKLVPQDSIRCCFTLLCFLIECSNSFDGLEEKTHTSSGETDKRGECLKSRGESKETATAIKGSKKFDDKRPASPQEPRKEKKREDDLWGSSLERETPQVPKDKSSKLKKDDVNKSHKKIPHEDENNNKHDRHHDTMHRSKTSKDSKCRLTPKEKTLGTTDTEKLYEDKESKKKHQNPKSTPEQPVQQPLPSKAEAKYSMTSSDSAKKESFDDAGEKHFTGHRCNKKMQVYSGNKSAFLPSMMSLYQQCIRALQNNIDMLYDTGGVPFEILEPVLERCTPDQLLRIEEYNPVRSETDHFWGRHCERDFRGARLLEYESWKEMYVRLSEERENKFKRLAKTIVSAHSKKPQGRQVKMAFIHTVAKPPRDVRIQQEMYGTAGAVQPSAVRARWVPSAVRPTTSPCCRVDICMNEHEL
uniref:Elongin A, like n=1 Tax=Gadus morhua TaxID=8049 RepID=A0A8C4Z4I6_GADMO